MVAPVRIVGLDPSTARIGYAADDVTRSIISAAGAEDPSRRLHELRRDLVGLLRRYPPLPDLVAVEGYSLGKTPGNLARIRLGEVGGMIRLALFDLDLRVVDVPPSSLKRYATGNGNADKDRMLARARELGAPVSNHDEADAWLLRRMARAAHGLEPVELDHERDAIANAGIAW